MCSAICNMLAALGCKLRRLRLHSLNHSFDSVMPAIWKHCRLLSHLEVEDTEFDMDHVVRSLGHQRSLTEFLYPVVSTTPVSTRPLD